MTKKMLFVITTFLLLTIGGNTSFAIKEKRIIKVGFVDYNRLIEKIDQSGKISSSIEEMQENSDAKIQDLEDQIDNLSSDLQNDPSADEVNNKISTLEQKRVSLTILKVKTKELIIKKTDILLGPLKAKITRAVKRVASIEGYDIILDKAVVLVGDSSLDITNKVLKYL